MKLTIRHWPNRFSNFLQFNAVSESQGFLGIFISDMSKMSKVLDDISIGDPLEFTSRSDSPARIGQKLTLKMKRQS